MLISYLRIKGWRSFAPNHEVQVSGLGRVNLLIGPNNVGKSNLGRFLVWLRDALSEFKGTNWAHVGIESFLNIKPYAKEVDFWLRGFERVEAELGIAIEALNELQAVPDWLLSEGGTTLRVRITLERGQTMSVVPITNIAGEELEMVKKEGGTYQLLAGSDGTYTERVTHRHGHSKVAHAVCHLLATRVLEIQPLRNPNSENSKNRDFSTNGSGTVAEIRRLKNENDRRAYWNKYEQDLEDWFKRLLDEDELRIDIIESGLLLRTVKGGERFDCALEDLGAGVSELLMMLAFLRLRIGHRYLVVMDEPEAHLHPGAVVELFRILTSQGHMPGQQFLVSTHSTALVDGATSDWRIFRAYRGGHQGTAIDALDAGGERALLADLGLRPSQLFLARVAIWVEGPSDVKYWTALLAEVDPQLVVGRDFAFIVYGGASGAHLQLEDLEESDEETTERVVKVMRISHRAVIVCDRDKEEGEIERTVVRRLCLAAKKIERYARVVTTPGREVENMVRPDVLKAVLETVRPKKLKAQKDASIELTYIDYAVRPDETFDRVVANAARTVDGKELGRELSDRVKRTLNQRKTKVAELVIEAHRNNGDVFTDEAKNEATRLVQWMREEP